MEKFHKIVLCALSFFVTSAYCCLLSGSGGSCLMSGLSFGGRISLPENGLGLLADNSPCPSARKRIFIFQRPRTLKKGKSMRSMLGHSGIGRIWMSKGSSCRNPTEETNLHCPVPEDQSRPCLDNSIPCHLDLTPPSCPVVKIEPSGTTKIELPPKVTEGSTGYVIEYRKVNDTKWKHFTFVYNVTDPNDFPGFEEGFTHELKITPMRGGSYDNQSEIFDTFTMPCGDIDVDLSLSSLSRRHGMASVKAEWKYRDLSGPCAVTNQTISITQIDLDNCTNPSDPSDKFAILDHNRKTYKVFKEHPNTEYNVSLSVYAHNTLYRTSKLVRTRQTAPSAAPTIISANRNGRRLSIRWDKLPCGKRNGQVHSYSVKMESARGLNVHNFRSTRATYSGFTDGEEFSIQVAAINSIGTGPYSPKLTRNF